MIKLADNVYAAEFQKGRFANYATASPVVILGDSSSIVCDAGSHRFSGNFSGQHIDSQIINFVLQEDKPIDYMFLTHYHGDHTDRTENILAFFGLEPRVHAHANINKGYKGRADKKYDEDSSLNYHGFNEIGVHSDIGKCAR